MQQSIQTIDYIIFAHNFGDVKYGTTQSDMIPSLATRVKINYKLKPKCVAYDILFGCPVGLKVYFKPMLSSNQEWQNDAW
jgi:hypothetical protein